MIEETSSVQVHACQNGYLANPGFHNAYDHCSLAQLGTCLAYYGCMCSSV